MNGKAYRIIGLVLGLFVLFLWARQTQAQTPAIVSTQPAALTLTTGENGLITIAIEQASELFGYELQLKFDPAVVQVIDAIPEQPGVQIQPAGFMDESRGFAVINRVDNGSGTLEYAMTLLAPAEPISGSGPLLELGVLAIAPGNSPITLSVVLASRDGLALPVETMDGSLSVTGSQPPGGTSPGTAVVMAPATPIASAVETPTSPSHTVTPTDDNRGSVPRQSSSESSEASNSVIPSRRSGNDRPQSLPAANALQTVTAMESAVPTKARSLVPAATQERASASEPGDVASGEKVAMVESTSPIPAVTIASNQNKNNTAGTGAGWSPVTIGLLAGTALVVLASVLFGRRLLAKR